MTRWITAAIVLLLGVQPFARGQEYPTKPVRVISGFQPGGGSDIVARLLSEKLAETWGRPFIVDNRSGAGGTIAMTLAAKAPEIVAYLAREGAVPKSGTPDELASAMRGELAKWGKVITTVRIKFD